MAAEIYKGGTIMFSFGNFGELTLYFLEAIYVKLIIFVNS